MCLDSVDGYGDPISWFLGPASFPDIGPAFPSESSALVRSPPAMMCANPWWQNFCGRPGTYLVYSVPHARYLSLWGKALPLAWPLAAWNLSLVTPLRHRAEHPTQTATSAVPVSRPAVQLSNRPPQPPHVTAARQYSLASRDPPLPLFRLGRHPKSDLSWLA